MNRTATAPPAVTRAEAGRTILEALVGLSLIALAVVSWSRMAVSAARAEGDAAARGVALEIATTQLESLAVAPWDQLAVDPAGAGYVRRFEGRSVVADPDGLVAEVPIVVGDREFTVTRLVLDPGSPAWRALVIEVEWADGGRDPSVRLDGAARRPDVVDP